MHYVSNYPIIHCLSYLSNKTKLSIGCLLVLMLYVISTICQLNRDGSSWVEPVLSWDKSVLLKDHNTVKPVRLEPAAFLSRLVEILIK